MENADPIEFLHQMFNVSALLLDDPLTNGAINDGVRKSRSSTLKYI